MDNKNLNSKDFNSREDVQKFIDENNVESHKELAEKYSVVFNKARRLFSLKLLHYHPGYTGPKTKNALKKFIKENKITSSEDFSVRFPNILEKLKEFNLELSNFRFYKEKVMFPKEILDKIEVVDDFQKFIDDNNITSSEDFNKRFHAVYHKLISLKLQKKIRYHYVITEYDGPKTIDEIQKFIYENKIVGSIDFSRRFCHIYKVILESFGFRSSKITYYGQTKKRREATDEELNIKSLKDIQDYVIKYKIMSQGELEMKSSCVYNKYLSLRKDSLGKDILFLNSSLVESKQEELLIRELIQYGITEFQTKFYIEESEHPNKRFDVYIPKFNMILEVHGDPHFVDRLPENWRVRDERENDMLKYKLALDNGYKIYYIAYRSSYNYYKKNGYFQKVYPSFKTLMDDLGIELQENKNFEEDFMKIYSDDFLSLASRICKEFEIYTIEDLMKFENFYNLVSQFNLQDKIVFCNESDEQLKIKIKREKLLRKGELTTVEEFQDFIIKHKIKKAFDFKKRFYTKYYNMVELGLSDKVVYYEKEQSLEDYTSFLDNFNTLEDFQNLIDKHDFKNADEMRKFSNEYNRLYRKMCKLGFHTKVIFRTNYEHWTSTAYQRFIIKNKITSEKDLKRNIPSSAYKRAVNNNFLEGLTYYSEEQDLQEQQ